MIKTWKVEITNIGRFSSDQWYTIMSFVPAYVGSYGNESYFSFVGFKTKREALLFKKSAISFLSYIGFEFHAVNRYGMPIDLDFSVIKE